MSPSSKVPNLSRIEMKMLIAKHGGHEGARLYLAEKENALPSLKQIIFWQTLLIVCNVDTSSDPERWSEGNPLWGHSLPIALLMHEEYGGKIIRRELNNVEFYKHLKCYYTNRLFDGVELDMSRPQMLQNLPSNLPQHECPVEYLLADPVIRGQFELLKSRFNIKLNRTHAVNGINTYHNAI